jgi:methylated-DNA-[protein]-cysteine S-methyltransferase
MKLYLSAYASPIGELLIVSDAKRCVRALDFADHRARLLRLLEKHYGNVDLVSGNAVHADVAGPLDRYFAGNLTALDQIRTATNGSELERRVWDALRRIPVGTTASYKGVAHSLGLMDPRAAIDIGAANKENPVAIIVPCHRVIANDGQLKGYAGGVHRKKWLLNHEGALKAEERLPETVRLPGL